MSAVRAWVVSSIEPSVYLMAKETITDELNAMQNPPQTPDPLMEIEADRISIRRLVAHLQKKFGTDNVNLKDQIKQDYFERVWCLWRVLHGVELVRNRFFSHQVNAGLDG
ncbi:hypothetical protein E4U09_006699 [Claviceps aff. purpurea]|uniref:Uncharacterized protein n=1 Tax=Claviceps aff. purpurea TaxID=1967640 RepID=A0A9P7QD28_9HYPO|nr:hypothetical protein E4U09_006699 [Claviceps aff. purpurea]